jgi:fructoselysine transporter
VRTTSRVHSQAASIGVGSAAALVAGNMIGAGVFTTSGFALADLGSRNAVLLAWFVGGLIALCGAWSYVRLAAAMPGNGGEYLFLSRAVHPLAGFLAGWVSLLAGFTAPIAVAAHGLEAYALESFGLGWPPGALGAAAIVLAGLAHGVKRESGLTLQNWAVSAQIAAIAGFILLGLFRMPSVVSVTVSEPAAAVPISAFAVTLIWVSFAYSGWNAAVYVAGELGEPKSTLMRATLLGTLGVVALYVALNAVFVYAAPIEILAGRAEVGAIAAEALAGGNARRVLSAIVGLGLLTSISAMVMVGPRIYAKMADDGVLPRALRSGEETPRAAILLQVGLALIAFFLAELRELLLYVGFLLGLSAAGTVACLFVIPRPPDVPGNQGQARRVLWVPLLFVGATLGSAGFMVVSEPRQAIAGFATLAVGVAIYALASRSDSARPGPTPRD